jgi:outer membrane protein TolC
MNMSAPRLTVAKALSLSLLTATFNVSAFESAPLSLHDSISMLLENNFDLSIREATVSSAEEQLNAVEAMYDPSFFYELSFDDNRKRQNSLEFTSTGGISADRFFDEESLRMRSGISGDLPTGAEYEVFVQSSELENTITRTSATSLFETEYETFAGISLKQPLLNGLLFGAPAAPREIAQIELAATEYEQQILVVNKVTETINAYYDLLFGQENLQVKREAEGVASLLLDENQRRFDAGTMAPIDVSQAEVRLSEAVEERILAQDFLRDRRVGFLKLVLSEYSEASIPRFEVVETLPEQNANLDASELVRQAQTKRPDLNFAREEANKESIRVNFARSAALPELNLNFTYGIGGLEGTYSRSFEDTFDGGQPRWSAGVVFRMPIGNRAAKSELRAARRLKVSAEHRVQQIEMNIRLEIQNAVERLDTLGQRLETAVRSYSFAKEALGSEQKRLNLGNSTSFAVTELQEKVSDANSRMLAAKIDLAKAYNEAYAASGMILEKNGFELTTR